MGYQKQLTLCEAKHKSNEYLTNCLQLIALNKKRSKIAYEVCISDNFSTDNTEDIVKKIMNLILV